jgi:hypothetical protein
MGDDAVRLVLRPIGSPAQVLASITDEPLAYSVSTYAEVRSFAFPDRPTVDRMPVSVRLAAVGNELKRNLILMSDLIRRLEALEWKVELIGDEVVATTDLSAEAGWLKLQAEGISDHLLPLLEKGSDRPPKGLGLAVRQRRARSEPPRSS